MSGVLTVAEIAVRVKRQFGDEAGAQITDTDIMRWINDAQRDIAIKNSLLQAKATAPLVVGQQEYSLPVNVLSIHSVKVNQQKLQALSLQEMDELVGDTTSGTGFPTSYYIWASSIMLYPIPQSASDILNIYFTRQPTAVDDVGDVPDLPSAYHSRIVEYCLAQAFELDSDMASYQAKMAQFNSGVGELKQTADYGQQDVYPTISVSAADSGTSDFFGGWY